MSDMHEISSDNSLLSINPHTPPFPPTVIKLSLDWSVLLMRF